MNRTVIKQDIAVDEIPEYKYKAEEVIKKLTLSNSINLAVI